MSHDDGRQIMEKLFGARICQDKDFDFFSIDCSSIYILDGESTFFSDTDWKLIFVSYLYLVDFDCPIDFSDEPIASKESNSSTK